MTSVEVTCSEAMLALSFSTLLVKFGRLFDENAGKVSTRVNGWQYCNRLNSYCSKLSLGTLAIIQKLFEGYMIITA